MSQPFDAADRVVLGVVTDAVHSVGGTTTAELPSMSFLDARTACEALDGFLEYEASKLGDNFWYAFFEQYDSCPNHKLALK